MTIGRDPPPRLVLRGCAGNDALRCDVGAIIHPDVGTIDDLARIRLVVRRHGKRLVLVGAHDRLRDLIVFVGLEDILPCDDARSGVEAIGHAEEREEALGVQEEADPGDPIT